MSPLLTPFSLRYAATRQPARPSTQPESQSRLSPVHPQQQPGNPQSLVKYSDVPIDASTRAPRLFKRAEKATAFSPSWSIDFSPWWEDLTFRTDLRSQPLTTRQSLGEFEDLLRWGAPGERTVWGNYPRNKGGQSTLGILQLRERSVWRVYSRYMEK